MAPSVLITGCSSGIGYDAAKTLQREGWQVFASCRDQADCDRLAAEGFLSPRLDYEDAGSMITALDEVLAQTGGTLDGLFNNGAFAIPGALEDLPVAGLRSIFETNFFGWHDLTSRVIPIMRAQGRGRIVMCSSVLGFVPLRWRGAYVSTKYALEGYTDVLRLEMRDTPITFSLIEPGPITTRIRENAIPHFERWIDWENAPRIAEYQKTLLPRLYEDRGPDRFELPPSAVTRALRHALTARRPRRRYRVTTPARIVAVLRRILPGAALDWILVRG